MTAVSAARTGTWFSLIHSVARPRVEMNSSGPFRSFRVYLIFLAIRFPFRSSFEKFPRILLHACRILLRQSRPPDDPDGVLPRREIGGRMRIGIVHQTGACFRGHSRHVPVREGVPPAGGDLEKHALFPCEPGLLLADQAGMSEDVDIRPYGREVGPLGNRLHDRFPVRAD